MHADALTLPVLYDALRGGRYALAVSLGITIVVWIGRALAPRLLAPKRAAWAAAVLGALAGVGGALADAEPENVRAWIAAVEQGLRTGGGAMLIWTLALKHVTPRGKRRPLADSAEEAARR